MGPIRALAIVLIFGGFLVVLLAANATGAFGRRLTEEVAGYTFDLVIWYVLAGLALAVGGIIALLRPADRSAEA